MSGNVNVTVGDNGVIPAGSPAAQAQTVWHINELTGNDANDALTAGTALRSYDELIRRVGQKWRVNNTVDIYLDSDITQNILVSMSLGANGRVVFHGKTTVTRTGTITGFTAEDLTSEATLITDGSQTWTAGTKIRTTGGSHPGAWCWVAKDKGAGVARTSHPGTNNYLVDALNTALVNLAPGDTYNVETQCVVNYVTFDLDGGVNNASSLSQVIFLDCDFVKMIVSFVPVIFVGCKFRFLEVGRISGTCNCCFTSLLIGTATAGSDAGLFLNTFFFVQYEGQWFFNNHPVFQAAKPLAKPSALLFFEDYGAFFDISAPLQIVYGSKLYVRHGVFGAGITGTAIQVDAGGQLRWTGTVFSFSGQTFDVTLGGRTQMYRIDPATGVSDQTLQDLSFANLLTAIGSGGFGGSAVDLYSQAAFLQVPDSNF